MTDQNTDKKSETESTPQKSSGFLSVIQSTLAALFGIQSEKNRQKDFKKGSAANYIVSGVIGVIVLLILMNVLVSSVISAG